MPTSVTVNDLKINELTEAQYDAAVQGGVIGENELSVITDMTDKAVQVSTMPTASATELGNIYQFTGTTDANYTNGYFYKCVSDGQDPATYSWTAVEVQASSGGSSYTAGTGISIDANNEISVADPVLVNKTTGIKSLSIIGSSVQPSTRNFATTVGVDAGISGDQATAIGTGAFAVAQGTAVGRDSGAYGSGSVAIGRGTRANANYSIQIGGGSGISGQNNDANTVKICNANGNFELMNANGNLPADRLASTTGLADGNYRLRLVMASGVPTLSWVAE